MLTVEAGVNVGDFVRLVPRERPFHDAPEAWWEIYDLDDTGISVRLWSGVDVVARRPHVSVEKVLAWRERA